MTTPADIRELQVENLRREISDGRAWWVLPRHGIAVQAFGDAFKRSGYDGPKFAAVFRATWSRIPLGPRRAMLALWRANDFMRSWQFLSPIIEVHRRECDRAKTKGETDRHGHRLRFYTVGFARYPETLLADLIAHELAHVHQHATTGLPVDVLEREEEADWLMTSWGFDAKAMDRWDADNGRVRELDWDNMSEAEKASAMRRKLKNGR